ncbi:MAG: ABC transporter ATP-binding protein [Planctomycetota bacterium]|nr:ABC transporter ATP-binding protein [Planctomycetota bacterium]
MSHDHEEVIATKAWDHSLFKRLLQFARPHRVLFAKSFAVLMSLFLLELCGTWIWRGAIDGPVAQAIPDGLGAVETRATLVRSLYGWVGVYVALIAIMGVLRYFEVATLTRTGQTVIHDMRCRIFQHLQHLDLAYFDKQPTGALVTRVTTDIENLSEMFTSGVVVLFFDVIKVVGVLGLLFAIDSHLAVVVTLMTPILIGLSIAFRGGARRAHRLVRARLARLNGYLQEVLSGIRVVQVFSRENRVSARFAEHLGRYFEANRRTIFLFALFYPSMSLAVFLIQGAALWVGIESIAKGSLSYGQFVQFWFLLSMLVRPIRELGERYNILQSAFASAERLFAVLDTPSTLTIPPGAIPLPANGGAPAEVRFEHVSFEYMEGTPVLQDVSFEIPAGKTVAVVGATGAGKSTLVNLLLRFYDPGEGQVRLGGVPLDKLQARSLRQPYGLVLQEDFLFSGSVRDNLVMGREGIGEDELTEALAASGAAPFVEGLEGGLEAPVAERGATFSTGERQLLAIARALAGRPDIIILDEATASVDSATEKRIEQATRSLLSGRSALVVAHRLSTIREADEILVMERGRIVERGTHESLLRTGGPYERLYKLQFEGQVGDGAHPG